MDHGDSSNQAAAETRGVRMLAVVAILVAATGPLWAPSVLGSLNMHSTTDTMAVETRDAVAQLERRVNEADQRAKASDATVARLKADVAQLEQRLTRVTSSLGLSALSDLADALRQRDGFARPLAAARAALAPTPEMTGLLDRITPYAETGIPAANHLRDRFSAAVFGDRGDAVGWFKRTVLRVSAPPPEEPDERLVRIDTVLREGDLAAAVMAATQLQAPRPDWLAAWLDDASARVAADTLVGTANKMAGAR